MLLSVDLVLLGNARYLSFDIICALKANAITIFSVIGHFFQAKRERRIQSKLFRIFSIVNLVHSGFLEYYD